jgi:hypothetical protein
MADPSHLPQPEAAKLNPQLSNLVSIQCDEILEARGACLEISGHHRVNNPLAVTLLPVANVASLPSRQFFADTYQVVANAVAPPNVIFLCAAAMGARFIYKRTNQLRVQVASAIGLS